MPRKKNEPPFRFSRQGLSANEKRLERVLEIVPGALSWTILVTMFALPFWAPIPAALIIIAFILYWLFRISYGTLFLMLAYVRLALEKETDWMAEAGRLAAGRPERAEDAALGWREHPRIKLLGWLRRQEADALARTGCPPPALDEIYHLVIIPVVGEGREVVEPGLRSIAEGDFPSKRMMIVYALEARSGEQIKKGLRELAKSYAGTFADLLIVEHPDDLPGEARVKGANVTYAAKNAAKRLTRMGVPFENVIVSCFDADTVPTGSYFGCLTYAYMSSPDRARASFQPIPVYHNNIWRVPGFAKVMETGSSFFTLSESTNPGKIVTFSSHSMSFQALVESGYWPVDIISDDSSIYWKCFLHYDGDYRVKPIYTTVSMDVADAGVWWKTARAVYKQKRRWAWGVEGFPILVRGLLRNSRIPFSVKWAHALRFLEGHVTWATWSILLAFSWLPGCMVQREFETSIVYYGTRRIGGTIFTISYLALFVLIALSLAFLPKKPVRFPWIKRVWFALQWLLLPVTYIFFSALPALEAQTRLMFGKYMEFWVTEKKRYVGQDDTR